MSDRYSMPCDEGRAWVEIDLGALAFNVAQLRSMLPEGCDIMAVVKTDAYGHGMERVAKRLREEGIRSFAVATVGEGVRLRECGLDGDILVLGYTHPIDAALLSDFELTQLVFDGVHAKALDETGHRMRVHIAIDTGMHREGIQISDLSEIESVFSSKNIAVEGLATHFAAADSLSADDVSFTKLQTERFYATVDALKAKGYNIGKLHTQASYGLYNHSNIRCDYVRVGIGLYGVMSHDSDARLRPVLRPVASLKAVISQTRWIGAGESVSYGRTYVADRPVNLATVCIGYADGIPRNMSGKNGACIVHGHRAPIVGRICMDVLMVDVTGIDAAAPGDIATLIGTDGDEEVRCEDVARVSGTITNEILCRLGGRLPRIYYN